MNNRGFGNFSEDGAANVGLAAIFGAFTGLFRPVDRCLMTIDEYLGLLASLE
jgi:hypothetical protein